MPIDSSRKASRQEGTSEVDDRHDTGRKPAFWWVNQGTSYTSARNGGYLWAPRANSTGQTRTHWTNMTLLRAGDRVFHYANGALRAVSRVIREAQEVETKPEVIRDKHWGDAGWLALVRMEELDTSVRFRDVSVSVREEAGSKGPFDSTGGIKQGYLFPLEEDAGRLLDDEMEGHAKHPIEHVFPVNPSVATSQTLRERSYQTEMSVYELIAAQGFAFPDWLVTDYVLSLATKPLVILSGISGTGKTKLAQIIARLVAPDEVTETVVAGPPVAGDDSFVHTIGLSTLKYRGLTLPVASLGLFEKLPQKGERIEVTVRLENGKDYSGWIGNVDFSEPTSRTAIRMFWERSLGTYLAETASEGDYLVVTPEAEKHLLSVRMKLEKPRRVQGEVPSSRIAFLSVRPDWTDNRSLLGYYNPLTVQYQSTKLLALLLRAKLSPQQPHFVILDEMNLAKVEYYFSDFLSAMESGTEMILHDSPDELSLDESRTTAIPRRMPIPSNVFFCGTVNVDETTYMFSPKVLDRSNVIEFNEVDLGSYPATRSSAGAFRLNAGVTIGDLLATSRLPSPSDWVALAEPYKDRLRQIHGLMAPHHLHFGYRVANEIARYMNLAAAFVDSGGLDIGFDLQLLQKVFPKLAGNRARLEKPLSELLGWCCRPDSPTTFEASVDLLRAGPVSYPHSAKKLGRMLETLRSTGFVSFVD